MLWLAVAHGMTAERFLETHPSQVPSEVESIMAKVIELRGQYLQEAVHYLDYLQQQRERPE